MDRVTFCASEANWIPSHLQNINTYIEDFAVDLDDLASDVSEIDGDLYDFTGALTDISAASEAERSKKIALGTVGAEIKEYLYDACKTDAEVAEMIEEKKDEFYEKEGKSFVPKSEYPWFMQDWFIAAMLFMSAILMVLIFGYTALAVGEAIAVAYIVGFAVDFVKSTVSDLFFLVFLHDTPFEEEYGMQDIIENFISSAFWFTGIFSGVTGSMFGDSVDAMQGDDKGFAERLLGYVMDVIFAKVGDEIKGPSSDAGNFDPKDISQSTALDGVRKIVDKIQEGLSNISKEGDEGFDEGTNNLNNKDWSSELQGVTGQIDSDNTKIKNAYEASSTAIITEASFSAINIVNSVMAYA